jgi:hypothetical protein
MTTETLNLVVLENTRSITIRPAEGVTAEQIAKSLNGREVKLEGKQLLLGSTGKVLGELVFARNTSDYEVAAEQNILGEFDTLDPYDFKYNDI